MKHYILEGKTPKEVDLMTWAEWFEQPDSRRVALTEEDGWSVSTVFLGIDHSFSEGPELLFETMVFGSETELDGEPFRYANHKEAEIGHQEIVEKVRKLKSER